MKNIFQSSKKMLPYIIVVILVVATLVLVGCTKEVYIVEATTTTQVTTTTEVKVTTTTEAPTATQEPWINSTTLFLDTIHSDTYLGLYYDDATLIGIAKTICEGIESGLSGDEIIDTIVAAAMQNGLTEDQIMDMAKLAGAGVGAFCPEYSYIFN